MTLNASIRLARRDLDGARGSFEAVLKARPAE